MYGFVKGAFANDNNYHPQKAPLTLNKEHDCMMPIIGIIHVLCSMLQCYL